MTNPTSLRALAQRALTRSQAGQSLEHPWDSAPGQVSQVQNQLGHLKPAENRHSGQVSQCPTRRGVGQWDNTAQERDSRWDTSGTLDAEARSYDAESGLPVEWIEGYRRLVQMPPPAAIPTRTWTWLQAAAGELLTRWGRQLVAQGWTTPEVFGVHFEAPIPRVDCAGLLALLSVHHKIEAITAKLVSLRTESGAVLHLYRPLAGSAGVVPVWDLATGAPGRPSGGDTA
jgi:hypothetical protein